MLQRPSRTTRMDTPLPYTPSVRSHRLRARDGLAVRIAGAGARAGRRTARCRRAAPSLPDRLRRHEPRAEHRLDAALRRTGDAGVPLGVRWTSRRKRYLTCGRPAWSGLMPDDILVFVAFGFCAQLVDGALGMAFGRSEEHTSELQSLMRNSYAVFCLTNN